MGIACLLCFTVLQIKFTFRQFISIFVKAVYEKLLAFET